VARLRVKQLRLKIAEAVSKRLRLKAVSNRLLATAFLVHQRIQNILVSDAYSVSDLFAALFGKTLQDSASTSDNANLDIGVNPQDEPLASDLREIDVAKALADGSTVLDLLSNGLSKPFSDSYSMSDQANVTFGKRPVETVGTVDVQVFAITKGLNDTVYATDDIGAEATIDDDQTIQVQKRLIELPSASDIVSKVAEYARSFSDSGSTADTIELEAAYQRAFTESPSVADTVSRAAGYVRSFSDSSSMTDSAIPLVGKRLFDILDSSDSGVLLNQDYVDNNLYFADDYVGLKRIF
jgi:hypothetical protein